MRQDEAQGGDRRRLAVEPDRHDDGAECRHRAEGGHRLELDRAQRRRGREQHGDATDADQQRAEPGKRAEPRIEAGDEMTPSFTMVADCRQAGAGAGAAMALGSQT